jgi:hypothetical protein
MTHFKPNLFTDLAQGDPSKPFDGMAAGTFIDMYGRRATFKKEELSTYVANTKKALASTKDSSGAIVGLPIDCRNHDHGDAAGWVVDCELAASGDKVQFMPRWTQLGQELIGKDIQRFFSPTIDTELKVIQGGSLTNWPAMRSNKTGEILLSPVEMAAGTESLNSRLGRICQAFMDFFYNDIEADWDLYPIEVFDDHLIVSNSGKLYSVPFTEVDGELQFSAISDWQEMQHTYAPVEHAIDTLKTWFTRLFARPKAEQAPVISEPEEDNMFDFAKLTPQERQAAITQLLSGSNPPAELAALIDARATERAAELVAAEQRKAHAGTLAAALIGGTAETKRGLPLDKAELTALLLEPTAEKLEAALSAIQAKGLIEYAETGHSNEVHGRQELPAEVAKELDGGRLKLADLANPILALGDLAQYNLTKWKEK